MDLDSQGNKKKSTIGFTYAWNGLKHLVRTEKNFQRQITVAAITVGLGVIFRISWLEWLHIILIITLVLSLEAVNTAVERLMDYLAPDFHPAAGLVKDLSAGAVFIAALASVIIGFIIFGPKIFFFFESMM